MGNYLDTTADPKSPLQKVCARYPDKAEQLKSLSGMLGCELWPEGGVGTLEGMKYIEKIIWTYNTNVATKELIGLWRQYYQELSDEKETKMLANWQETALNLGIHPPDPAGLLIN